MNIRNQWKSLLKSANEELSKYGVAIDINDNNEKGFYTCNILQNGKLVETYAENYYENELDYLVTEAWHYALTKIIKK